MPLYHLLQTLQASLVKSCWKVRDSAPLSKAPTRDFGKWWQIKCHCLKAERQHQECGQQNWSAWVRILALLCVTVYRFFFCVPVRSLETQLKDLLEGLL